MLAVIALATFFLVMFSCLAIYYLLSANRQAINERMNTYLQMQEAEAAKTGTVPADVGENSLRSLLRQAGKLFESPQWKWTQLLEHKLVQAGLALRSSEYMALWTGVTLLGIFLGYAFSGGTLLFAVLGGAIGGYAPYLYLKLKIQKRAKAFNDQLGDTLVLMANSLRTGYSFLQAVDMVAREMPPPISLEFSRALQEMSFGVATEDALNNMALRIDSDDLDLVITVVLIQRQVGGNLAEIMDSIAGTIRERVRIKGQIRTLTAQGRISGLIIGGLPVVMTILIYLINPEYMSLLFTTPQGKMMLLIGLTSLVLGGFAIRKVIDIDV